MRKWLYIKLRQKGFSKKRAYNVSLTLETIIGGVSFFVLTILILIMSIVIGG